MREQDMALYVLTLDEEVRWANADRLPARRRRVRKRAVISGVGVAAALFVSAAAVQRRDR